MLENYNLTDEKKKEAQEYLKKFCNRNNLPLAEGEKTLMFRMYLEYLEGRK